MMQAAKSVTAACLVAVLSVVAGCQLDRAGEPVMTLAPGTAPELGTAKVAGFYGLYVGKEAGRALARNYVKAGEPLGFATAAKDSDKKPLTGSLFAVAGDFALPIDPMETFEWRRVPETEARDLLQIP